MANTAQSKKRARQNEKHRQHNTSRRSEMRTYMKRVLEAVKEKNQDLAENLCRKASSTLDRMAGKGLIHKNMAARNKSRLTAHLKKMTATTA